MGLKDILPVEKIYDDLLSPSVKQVGLALESVFKTARFSVAPFDMAAALYDNRWQKFIKRISDKVEPQNIVEGQPQIVIPVLNALDLQQEDSLLSELFINLLSASIDKTKQDLAHPAFPNILTQLSYYEATILYYLKKGVLTYYTFYVSNVEGKSYYTEIYFDDTRISEIGFPNNNDVYISHLSSLNLILKDDNDEKTQDGTRVNNFMLSYFGKLLADACIPDEFGGL